MNIIFVYGTLCNPKIQKCVIGRVIESSPDRLSGFKLGNITLGINDYPIIEKSEKSDAIIDGIVLHVTDSELIKMDKYETDAYKRVKVLLESGIESWVYLANKKNMN